MANNPVAVNLEYWVFKLHDIAVYGEPARLRNFMILHRLIFDV